MLSRYLSDKLSSSSRDHHANSLFESSRLLSPGTTNLISMTKRRTDRTKFSHDWSLSDQCHYEPDKSQNQMSSIPTKHYNQQQCVNTEKMKVFGQTFNCNILSMFGTGDLNTSTPMCNRSNTQKMMDMLSMMDNITCPFACISEWIDTSISFTLLSDLMFQNACKQWKICDGLTKQDAAWMDLYFTSLQTEVSTINHQDKSSLLYIVGDSDCPSDYPGPAQQYWWLSWTILGGKHIFSH